MRLQLYIISPTIFEQVWLGLALSIVCVIAVLSLLDFILFNEPGNDNKLSEDRNSVTITSARPGKQYLYVFGNLLSQGNYKLNCLQHQEKMYRNFTVHFQYTQVVSVHRNVQLFDSSLAFGVWPLSSSSSRTRRFSSRTSWRLSISH